MLNNSIVAFEDIPAGTALLCSTDKTDCCQSNAFWISPSATYGTNVFSVANSSSLLVANRMVTGPGAAEHNGMWHCEIPDSYNVTHKIYVGLFNQG